MTSIETSADSASSGVLETSRRFWAATESSDVEAMRAIAAPECRFVHIGITCDLDREIRFYEDGVFQPTGVDFHGQDVTVHGPTAVVISDVDYSLLLDGKDTRPTTSPSPRCTWPTASSGACCSSASRPWCTEPRRGSGSTGAWGWMGPRLEGLAV